MRITKITAEPFENDQLSLFQSQMKAKKADIQALIEKFSAVDFQCGDVSLMYHPSVKNVGGYQITTFRDGCPISDSQHETKMSVVARLVEYCDLEVVKTISC